MKKIRLGRSDLEVSRICLGTMTFGEQNTEAEGHSQLDYAFSRGINFIDTAEMYPVKPRAETYGSTERIIGTWLKKQPRDRVVLASKVAGPARNPWIRNGGDLTPDGIRAAVEDSSSGCRPTTSTSTRFIGRRVTHRFSARSASTPKLSASARQSRRNSKRWAIWCGPARSATSACRTKRRGA
jgi:hypothetical protein